MTRTILHLRLLLKLGLFFTVWALASRPTSAWAAPESSPDRTLSPYFFVEAGDSSTDQLPLLSTTAEVDIDGVIAHVEVTQTYKNAGAGPISARYVFPASTRAAVHGMTMQIGERRIEARIREREDARAEYEAAKKAGKTASLLEEDRPNVFSMGVANIMPGDEIEVSLRYTELLVPDQGTYEFVYPTTVGPRYSSSPAQAADQRDQFVVSPFLSAGDAPKHTFDIRGTVKAGFPIARVKVTSHRVNPKWTDKKTVNFELDPGEKQGANRDFVLRYQLAGSQIQSGITLFESANEKFFLAMVAAPQSIAPEAIPPREYVFVLDVSGSMHGFPLDTAKRLMRDLVGKLRAQDRFNILYFSGGSELWSERSQPATKENLRQALTFLDRTRGAGGTELLSAMRRALALPSDEPRSRSFVVVTDGYIAAEAEVFEHIRSHLGEANVFSFGIGSSVNRHLVEGIAQAGQGLPFVVTKPSEAEGTAARFRRYIEAPALTNVRARFEGFDAYDVQPQSIPDVLGDRPVVLMGKYRGKPEGHVTFSGLTGTGPYRRRVAISPAQLNPGKSALPYLWARARIRELSDFAPNPIPTTTRQQVVDLGLAYNLLTPYTSFVAVAEEVRAPKGDSTEVVQPSALPAGVSNQAVGAGVVGADEPSLTALLALVFGLTCFGPWVLRAARRRNRHA